MSKIGAAMKLADEFGVSVSKAQRFIDDVGSGTVDDLLQASDEASGKVKLALGSGTILGGGALAWRQQDVARARAIAKQSKSYSSAIKEIMDSDLPPKMKRRLAKQAANQARGNPRGKDNSGGGPLSSLFGGGAQTTMVLIIVLIFALKFGLQGGEE